MIGDASGKNWWCVLFPPVCISAAEAKREFENAGMTDEEKVKLLASDGMLVKRPLLIGDDFVLVGFKESDWAEKISK